MGSATAGPSLLAVDSAGDAANSGKRGRGRPKGSGGGKRQTGVPAAGQEKLAALVAFVFQWASEMLAGVLDMPELGFIEVETDEGKKVAEADVLAVYPTRYLVKTALGKQAAKLAADEDLVKTLVILGMYSLRVTPAIVRKWNDVTTTRPAMEIGRAEIADTGTGNIPANPVVIE